ncbi:chorismate mutase [Streptomyces sp. TRM64462]|uniref:chorismate mutase n=1 Tax=Streptomyces sp. TRM64462 TaxID=2741726 RepID=UPI001C30DCFB|nr:chorismate mutase [Streptomyces sp. TRM64462]
MSPEAGPRATPAAGPGTTPPAVAGGRTGARTPDGTSTAAGLAAVRGAIAVADDTAPAIARATHDLLAALLAANRLERADLLSLMFTQTPDLTATNPALVLHEAGWDLPALCAQDAAFDGAPARTLRVLAHLRWDRPGRPVPAYLAGAAPTRPGT